MSQGRNVRPIGQRMARARSPEKRAEVASEWAEEWIGKANILFKTVENDIDHEDYAEAAESLHDLYQDTFKRLYALKNIFQKISEAKKSTEISENSEEPVDNL